ncbi:MULTISPECIES: hypothetical protein [Clostridium]|uniref:Uncharacterized protein n=2 Tax=Clostridium TaxID=1485 RepID=A0A151ARZ7_9CLOT|nr:MULTISPECIES: hypothetical protein [Clostridium]KYH30353.1 hypothetical protein CLCOL_02990 [Clostridium colicanis DSM 13634]MBE6044426.1 hypothetical protein [Clostridium thermopalmarium]PRR69466.1 hypothetical protein CPAL_25520 [Clostridium thermopalmarium DSM 5974]PVZ26268.1 hypothetical protein LX19_00763 [Clostridium thermopalmarium DSM 5974]
MSDKLLIINDLSSIKQNMNKHKYKTINYIIEGIRFSIAFLILRIIFILPVFIISNENLNFLEFYIKKYSFSSISYDHIWNNFKYAFSTVLQNNDYLIKYMIISFIILSFILVTTIKSPIGILISFIFTTISPYLIENIFLPIISFIYIPVNFICSFIDGLIPSFIPVLLIWGGAGAIFGILRLKKMNRN